MLTDPRLKSFGTHFIIMGPINNFSPIVAVYLRFFNTESKIILKANEGNKVATRCHPCDLEMDFCGRRGDFFVRACTCVRARVCERDVEPGLMRVDL